MKDKVIYLDFDGVINNSNTKLIDIVTKHGIQNRHTGLDPCLVERINQIHDATGAVVWVHSSWREVYSEESLKKVLAEAGLRAPVHGNVPFYSKFGIRGPDVRQHVESYGIERYVILDDMGPKTFEKQDREFHVQTSSIVGIQDQDVERAIEILNK